MTSEEQRVGYDRAKWDEAALQPFALESDDYCAAVAMSSYSFKLQRTRHTVVRHLERQMVRGRCSSLRVAIAIGMLSVLLSARGSGHDLVAGSR
jgi:hypothetical protein